MEKLYIIITSLLKGIISSHTQLALNSGGSGVNEVWNFSALTATFTGIISPKHTISQLTYTSLFTGIFLCLVIWNFGG